MKFDRLVEGLLSEAGGFQAIPVTQGTSSSTQTPQVSASPQAVPKSINLRLDYKSRNYIVNPVSAITTIFQNKINTQNPRQLAIDMENDTNTYADLSDKRAYAAIYCSIRSQPTTNTQAILNFDDVISRYSKGLINKQGTQGNNRSVRSAPDNNRFATQIFNAIDNLPQPEKVQFEKALSETPKRYSTGRYGNSQLPKSAAKPKSTFGANILNWLDKSAPTIKAH